MPLVDYEELNLEGMNVDTVGHHFDILEARFAGAFRRSARVGTASGEQTFALTAGLLPDDVDYGSLIDGAARFPYYYDFWKARMAAGNEPFAIEWRSKFYTVVFRGHDFSYETFTADLFAAGIELEQVRVVGETYAADGSLAS